jgi:phage terminase large subunit-like protein
MTAQGPPPSPTPATATPQQEPISPKRKKILEDLNKLTTEELIALNSHAEWVGKRHKHQAPPPGKWTIWLMLAGRGAGKTRAAAEWLWFQAYQKPESRWLVSAPTSADVRDTCFEGDSGLMSVIPERVVKEYNRSLSEIVLKNGSLIKGISAETPDRLRGGQWHGAWCHPAGTPVLMADGSEKPIEQIQVGDVVQTRFGPHSVTAAGLSHNPAPLYRISYGTTNLTCTADHPILIAGRGWVPAESVSAGDQLWIPLSLTDKYGVNVKTGITETAKNNTYIGTFTNSITALLHRATLCIMPITTLLTTMFQTWCLCAARNITVITQRVDQRLINKSRLLQRLLFACGKSWNWTLKAALAAANSLNLSLYTKLANSVHQSVWKSGVQMLSSLKLGSAWSAKQITWLRDGCRSIAASLAIKPPLLGATKQTDQYSLNAASTAAMLTKANGKTHGFAQDPAPFAITAKINAVERLKTREPVYNLTVDAVNEYVAGGVVVHNCDELAAWQYDQEAWDMIMFALRLGKHPRIVATTTPKPKALIRELIERDGDDVAVVRASTYENIANLAPTFQQQLLKFEGTTLGRQEIHAEVLNPEEQGIIKRNWIKLWPAKKPLPVFEHIVMSMDTAFTEQTRDKKTSDADPSACVVLGLFYNEDKPNIMLLDCWEDRLGMPDLIKRVHKEREVYYGDDSQRPMIKPMIGPSRQMGTGRKPDTIVIEDKGSGISLRQMLARENILAHAYNPGKASKLTRLHMVSHLFASGMVWFVESEKRKGQIRSWAEPLLYQLCAFSGEGSIRHDDLMDACTQGLRFLADKDMISVSKPKPLQPRLIVNSRPRMNPYGV